MGISGIKEAMKTIRYGTVITPSIAKGVVGSFPGCRSQSASQRTTVECTHAQVPQVSFDDVERLSNSATTTQLSGRYPSISTILGCTQSQRNLYWWQLKMIKQLGGEGSFRRYMRERIQCGIAYHSRVREILLKLSEHKSITLCDDELLEGIPDAVLGYIRSVLPVLRSLQHSEFTQLEQYAHHHLLCYLGRFDAIVSYRDALLVIDWKTASSGSSKDTMVDMELAKMYNDPLQVAAYIGAINSDMKFSHLPTITNGALVVAKEDGSTAQFVQMHSSDVQEYWQKWLDCVRRFWYELETRPSKNGIVSFVSRGE